MDTSVGSDLDIQHNMECNFSKKEKEKYRHVPDSQITIILIILFFIFLFLHCKLNICFSLIRACRCCIQKASRMYVLLCQ